MRETISTENYGCSGWKTVASWKLQTSCSESITEWPLEAEKLHPQARTGAKSSNLWKNIQN